MVIEAVAEPLGRKLTAAVRIPTIGIGASAACDGQILVLEDMLGLSPRVPKFVKRYGELGPGIEKAVADYAADVRARAFPGPEHVYAMKGKKPLNSLNLNDCRPQALPWTRHIARLRRNPLGGGR